MELLDKFLRMTGKNDSPPTSTDLEQEVSSVEASDNNLEHEFEKLKNTLDEQQSAEQKIKARYESLLQHAEQKVQNNERRQHELNFEAENKAKAQHQVIHKLSVEIAANKKTIKRLKENNAEFHCQFSSLEDHCETLQQSLDISEEQHIQDRKKLEEARNLVVELQPSQEKFTETEAIDRFESLCESIETWVEVHLGDALASCTIQRAVPSWYDWVRANDLFHILPQNNLRCIKVPGTDHHNLMSLIMRHLKREIFDSMLVGARIEDIATLERCIQAMKIMEPPRKEPFIQTWKSEALHALYREQGFKKRLDHIARKLSRYMIRQLVLFGRSDAEFEVMGESFHEMITEPTVQLALAMQLSSDTFELRWTTCQDSNKFYWLSKDLFNDACCLDVAQDCTKIHEFHSTKDIAYYCDILPALLSATKLLVPHTLLVASNAKQTVVTEATLLSKWLTASDQLDLTQGHVEDSSIKQRGA